MDIMMPEEMKNKLIEAMAARMNETIDKEWRIAFEGDNAAIRDKCNEWIAGERWQSMKEFLRGHIASTWKAEDSIRDKGLVDLAGGFLRERMAYTNVLSKMIELEEAENGEKLEG